MFDTNFSSISVISWYEQSRWLKRICARYFFSTFEFQKFQSKYSYGYLNLKIIRSCIAHPIFIHLNLQNIVVVPIGVFFFLISPTTSRIGKVWIVTGHKHHLPTNLLISSCYKFSLTCEEHDSLHARGTQILLVLKVSCAFDPPCTTRWRHFQVDIQCPMSIAWGSPSSWSE